MTKTIIIDGKKVELRSSAALLRMYRIRFHRDLIVDMAKLEKTMKKRKDDAVDASDIPIEALEIFENVAYLMAKHANPETVPNSPDEWLEGFETFSIYQVFPKIEEMWKENTATLSKPQKK